MLRAASLSNHFSRRPTETNGCLRRWRICVAPTEPSRRGSFAVDKHDAFRELGLKESNHKSIGRVRQHVNPLSWPYRIPTEAPQWDSVFDDPELPLIVDAGTGYGRFPLLAAWNDASPVNYLGTEIRRPVITCHVSTAERLGQLVGRANLWAKELGLNGRVRFLFANITISLPSLLAGYPGRIAGIYIQFPDPCFKKKTIKRHIVQAPFVHACCQALAPEGVIFLQSDVESCAVYMRNMFEHYSHHLIEPHEQHSWAEALHEGDAFMGEKMKWQNLSWLEENPIGYPTEREVYSQAQGLKIYRTLLVKPSC